MLCFHKKSFSPSFFGIKLLSSIGRNSDLHSNLLFLLIVHHKLILHIGMNDIDALVSQEKLLFPLFFGIKLLFSIGTNSDSYSNSYLFMIGTINSFHSLGQMALMLWFHKKNFSFHHFLELKFICQLEQTQIHIIISFISRLGAMNSFSSLG